MGHLKWIHSLTLIVNSFYAFKYLLQGRLKYPVFRMITMSSIYKATCMYLTTSAIFRRDRDLQQNVTPCSNELWTVKPKCQQQPIKSSAKTSSPHQSNSVYNANTDVMPPLKRIILNKQRFRKHLISPTGINTVRKTARWISQADWSLKKRTRSYLVFVIHTLQNANSCLHCKSLWQAGLKQPE